MRVKDRGRLLKNDSRRDMPVGAGVAGGETGVANVTCEPYCWSSDETALLFEVWRVKTGAPSLSCSGLAMGIMAAVSASKISVNLDGRVDVGIRSVVVDILAVGRRGGTVVGVSDQRGYMAYSCKEWTAEAF